MSVGIGFALLYSESLIHFLEFESRILRSQVHAGFRPVSAIDRLFMRLSGLCGGQVDRQAHAARLRILAQGFKRRRMLAAAQTAFNACQ